jgi:hypothetical protein
MGEMENADRFQWTFPIGNPPSLYGIRLVRRISSI